MKENPMLTETRSILHLHRVAWAKKEREFRATPEERPEDNHRTVSIFMPDEVWEDMGCPETVTVTVEPGDLLNVDG